MHKIILENKDLISKFCQHFNRDLICGNFNQTLFSPSEEDLQIIFKVLNNVMFNDKLSDIPIFCLPKKVLSEMLKNAYSLDENQLKNARTSYAMYVMNPVETDNKLIPEKQCIVFNTSYGKEPFGFIVSCICHEMIHYYDICFGDYLNHVINKEKIDPHTTVTFLKLMKKAKETLDIPIVINGNNNPSKILYKSAQDFFTKESLEEDEELSFDKGQLIGNHTIIKRLTNKRWLIIEMD